MHPNAQLSPLLYLDAVEAALREDLGRAGDLTTDAIVPASATAHAEIVARRPGRAAGAVVSAAVFSAYDPRVSAEIAAVDGDELEAGQTVLRLEGPARSLLTAERTALNFLGHLSGIATLTGYFVEAVAGTAARVVCTRKTTPGLRALEKYAVRCGGGANHRFGLDDAVLIKDNHVAVAGGVRPAVERARAAVGHMVTVEVEVDTLDQLEEALRLEIDAVLLDNMDVGTLRRAVAMVGGLCTTEASGGITLETAAEIAATGVDLLSVGALTHSAPWFDVALDVTG